MKNTPDFQKNKDGSFTLTVTITEAQLQTQKTKTLKLLATDLKVKGFRKGQVPSNIAESKIDPSELLNRSVQEILSTFYADALKKHSLNPIIPPRVKTIPPTSKDKRDFVIKLSSCEKPTISLKPYQEEIKAINTTGKIWTPDQKNKPQTKEDETAKNDQQIQKIIDTLLKLSTLTLSDFLVEEETNRKLAQLIDQSQQAGIKLEDYFKAKGTSLQDFKKNFKKQLENEWTINLILEKIADDFKIVITPQDIEKSIPEKAKKTADRHLLAQILRQRQAIEKLQQL